MDKAKQLVIGLICGFDKDHHMIKSALEGGAEMALKLLETTHITKEDLFTQVNGSCVFEYKQTWENFQRIADYFRQQGDPLTGTDMLRSVTSFKNMAGYAKDNGALEKIMGMTDMWAGHFKAFQDVWFRHFGQSTYTPQYIAHKKAIFRAEGRVAREEKLEALGIKWEDIRGAINRGDFKELNQKFESGGDHLRREDLLLVDYSGDHTMYAGANWEHAPKLWAELAKHNELPTVEDFAFKCADRKSLIQAAAEGSYLSKVFDYTLWKDRPIADVMAVYAMLPESKRKDAKIEPLLDRMAEQMFWDHAGDGSNLTRAELMAAIDLKKYGSLEFAQLPPLAFDSVLSHLDKVQAVLNHHGESLHVDDFRQPAGKPEDTVLMQAARTDHFDKVMAVLAQTGERLTLGDLTAKGSDGKTVLEHLSTNDSLPQILKPQDWVGRGQELGELWKAMRQILPTNVTEALDYTGIQSKVSMLTVRQRFMHPQPGAPAP